MLRILNVYGNKDILLISVADNQNHRDETIVIIQYILRGLNWMHNMSLNFGIEFTMSIWSIQRNSKREIIQNKIENNNVLSQFSTSPKDRPLLTDIDFITCSKQRGTVVK